MARAEMSYKGWGRLRVPVGVWIHLDYNEAFAVSNPLTRQAVSQTVGRLGPWGAAAALAVVAQQAYIEKLNRDSGGMGVRCFFVPWTGWIMSVERLGFGPAPSPTPPEPTPPRPERHELEPGTRCWCGKIHKPRVGGHPN